MTSAGDVKGNAGENGDSASLQPSHGEGQKTVSQNPSALKVLWRNGYARVGLIITAAFFVMGFVGPLVYPKPTIDLAHVFAPPSLQHPLGTDYLGRDTLGDIIYGTGYILEVTFLAALIGTGIGVIVGIASGYFRGALGSLLMAITDIVLTIPGMILILVVASVVRSSNPLVVAGVLSVTAWAGFARAVRSQILSLRNSLFIEEARLLNLSSFHIIFRELMPNVMSYTAINFIFSVQGALFASVGLYFLGVLPFSAYNWGVMLSEATSFGAFLAPSLAVYLISPIAVITLFTVGLIYLSFGIDEVFNPRTRR